MFDETKHHDVSCTIKILGHVLQIVSRLEIMRLLSTCKQFWVSKQKISVNCVNLCSHKRFRPQSIELGYLLNDEFLTMPTASRYPSHQEQLTEFFICLS